MLFGKKNLMIFGKKNLMIFGKKIPNQSNGHLRGLHDLNVRASS
jgi:hypothetical protein